MLADHAGFFTIEQCSRSVVSHIHRAFEVDRQYRIRQVIEQRNQFGVVPFNRHELDFTDIFHPGNAANFRHQFTEGFKINIRTIEVNNTDHIDFDPSQIDAFGGENIQ
ncbi:Uncharacterised protein [Vibrio cholerae]|nr:Uncharacterised protein [Vibrio cholerae]CSC00578.1 Uncharacterised protein [Vibrio cholerae]CSC38622.1 Uncharacterised protein [Vibrio cholerae]